MKKLAYIILVIAILVVISHFVKQGNIKPAAENAAAIVVTTEDAEAIADATAGNAPVSAEAAEGAAVETSAAPAEDNDVVDVQENAEDIIIEEGAPEDDGAVDVEETNPEETIDEEETIIKE